MSETSENRKNLLLSGIVFGLTIGVAQSYMMGHLPPTNAADAITTLVMAVVAGGVFALLIGLFMGSGIVPRAEDIALAPGEILEFSTLANHFLKLEGRGGRLALTNTHLVFEPHAVNVQRSGLRIPRSEIEGVAPVKTLGIVPNGLLVTLKSGGTERFVVNSRSAWLAKLS